MTKYAGTLSRVITRRAGLKDLSLVESGKPVYLDHPVEPEVPQTSNNFFSVVDIQRFMLDIARGLAFLHKRRIIHRGTSDCHRCLLALAIQSTNQSPSPPLPSYCCCCWRRDARSQIRECLYYCGASRRRGLCRSVRDRRL